MQLLGRAPVQRTCPAHLSSAPVQRTGVSILISDKVDFKPKLVKRDKEGHFILLKGNINQEDIIM